MPKGTGQVKQQTQTQSQGPWSGQAPYLRAMYEGAANLPLQQHYPGQTVADQSPQTQQAIGMQTAAAQGGANQPRTQQHNQTLGGDYLYGGQGFNAALDAAHNQIAPMVQGQFEAGGRYGSGLAQEAETSALADAFAGQYGQERSNQMYAMGMDSPAYADAAALGQAGAQQDAYQQSLLSDQLNRWNFAQQAPYDRLAAQNAVIQSGYPGGQGISETWGPPSIMDMLGADLGSRFSNGIGNFFNPVAELAGSNPQITDRTKSYNNPQYTYNADGTYTPGKV